MNKLALKNAVLANCGKPGKRGKTSLSITYPVATAMGLSDSVVFSVLKELIAEGLVEIREVLTKSRGWRMFYRRAK